MKLLASSAYLPAAARRATACGSPYLCSTLPALLVAGHGSLCILVSSLSLLVRLRSFVVVGSVYILCLILCQPPCSRVAGLTGGGSQRNAVAARRGRGRGRLAGLSGVTVPETATPSCASSAGHFAYPYSE